uniref:F-box domain-containing protein n=2 Tax=Leersia perrieri TaxID=77586 RepID=A0A0D9VKJ6_9ORYZ
MVSTITRPSTSYPSEPSSNSMMVAPNIPEDVVMHKILVLLPVKVLMRFRCVCKSWCATISSRHFAEIDKCHSQSSLYCIFDDHNIPPGSSSINIQHLNGESYCSLKWLEDCFVINSSPDLIVLGHKGGYKLLNPALQQCVNIPPSSWQNETIHLSGFGFLANLGKYKMLSMLVGGANEDSCEVFTVGNDNLWRVATPPPFPVSVSDHMPFIKEKLHMLALDLKGEDSKLLAFDLLEENWLTMDLPLKPHGHLNEVYEIRDLQGFVCFICCTPSNTIDVWMLMDHADSVWSKYLAIDAESFARILKGQFIIDDMMHAGLYGFPIEPTKKGKIFLELDDGRWFCYDPRDQSIQVADHKGILTSYAENLVPVFGFSEAYRADCPGTRFRPAASNAMTPCAALNVFSANSGGNAAVKRLLLPPSMSRAAAMATVGFVVGCGDAAARPRFPMRICSLLRRWKVLRSERQSVAHRVVGEE